MNCFGIALIIGFMSCHPTAQQSLGLVSYCEAYRPIILRPSWPRDAKDQADERNRIWKALCAPAPKN